MIFNSKSLVLVRKGHPFYETLYQEVFFCNPRGDGSLIDFQACSHSFPGCGVGRGRVGFASMARIFREGLKGVVFLNENNSRYEVMG